MTNMDLRSAEILEFSSQRFQERALQIVNALLEDDPQLVVEASVHLSRRSRIYTATFSGPQGTQSWRTTGVTDYTQAMRLARRWEAQARAERIRAGRATNRQRTHVKGLLSQREVASLLGMTERGVRAVERRALLKLRRHPLMQQLWRRYRSGELDEAFARLTPMEIRALFDVARDVEELRLMDKVVRLIQG